MILSSITTKHYIKQYTTYLITITDTPISEGHKPPLNKPGIISISVLFFIRVILCLTINFCSLLFVMEMGSGRRFWPPTSTGTSGPQQKREPYMLHLWSSAGHYRESRCSWWMNRRDPGLRDGLNLVSSVWNCGPLNQKRVSACLVSFLTERERVSYLDKLDILEIF